jgi:hypothetical protein
MLVPVLQLDLVGCRELDSIDITVFNHDSSGDRLSNTQQGRPESLLHIQIAIQGIKRMLVE